MPDFDPVSYAIPAFVALVLIEMLWARWRSPQAYEPKDTLVSLLFGLGSTIAGLLLGGFALAMFIAAYEFRLFTIGWEWWAWPVCFVLDDLRYYWVHRFGHRSRWFWASHVNHHSSQHYNLSTALRQTWTGAFTLGFAFALPLVLLGFHPGMIAICGGFNLIYQFWIHTEVIDRMPRWFEAVMNTPSHHRVHHATNPRYLDRNYAGVFIVWDKLFGTEIGEGGVALQSELIAYIPEIVCDDFEHDVAERLVQLLQLVQLLLLQQYLLFLRQQSLLTGLKSTVLQHGVEDILV